ncbi:hypothetical protein [Paenibacillus contaminans]|uniref:Uncharacterized protein n=1 Tax=Paenibacillus contaminans TaxID=450362 RepID=A0A329LNF4_9BACL|nr:hypothetical protein [Paenibacillus contaminans]RAV08726.1 hypothetical protein DQG23_40645 [Paenibacillus contaminans]
MDIKEDSDLLPFEQNIKEIEEILEKFAKNNELPFPKGFCNPSSVFTLFCLYITDEDTFSNYRIVKILVDESDEQFFEKTNHWLICHKNDGIFGRFDRPVIDITCHQFQSAHMKRGILYPYPLKYKIIKEEKTEFTRTLIDILRSVSTQSEINEHRRDIHRFSILVGESTDDLDRLLKEAKLLNEV